MVKKCNQVCELCKLTFCNNLRNITPTVTKAGQILDNQVSDMTALKKIYLRTRDTDKNKAVLLCTNDILNLNIEITSFYSSLKQLP